MGRAAGATQPARGWDVLCCGVCWRGQSLPADGPADASHALESLKLTIKGAAPIEVGSDGRVSASDIEAALKGREKETKDVTHNVPIRIEARYVEGGADRRGGGAYVLRYKWEGGGLFGGRSLHLVGLSR